MRIRPRGWKIKMAARGLLLRLKGRPEREKRALEKFYLLSNELERIEALWPEIHRVQIRAEQINRKRGNEELIETLHERIRTRKTYPTLHPKKVIAARIFVDLIAAGIEVTPKQIEILDLVEEAPNLIGIVNRHLDTKPF